MRIPGVPRLVQLALCLGGALTLGGCNSLPSFPSMPSLISSDRLLGVVTPYKVEVVQGNVITKEQAAQVRPGMSRAQVRDVLGSPLLTDVFHANRWDYVFTIRRQGAEPQLRRVIVLFDGEKMESIDTGGELPWERDFVASIDTFKPSREAPTLQLTDDQIKALQPSPKPAPAAIEPVGPTRAYPPLEPAS